MVSCRYRSSCLVVADLTSFRSVRDTEFPPLVQGGRGEREGRGTTSLSSLYGTVFGDVTVTSEFAPPLSVSCDARRPCDSRVWGPELSGPCVRAGM